MLKRYFVILQKSNSKVCLVLLSRWFLLLFESYKAFTQKSGKNNRFSLSSIKDMYVSYSLIIIYSSYIFKWQPQLMDFIAEISISQFPYLIFLCLFYKNQKMKNRKSNTSNASASLKSALITMKTFCIIINKKSLS